jgi:hypothetical protein
MKAVYFATTLLAIVLVGVPNAADRKWQTGTWTDVGIRRAPSVADPVRERMPAGFNRPALTEVATYVIETIDRRFELQDTVALGNESFDLQVTVGHSVTFAIEQKTAYIKLDRGEYRLRVLKNEADGIDKLWGREPRSVPATARWYDLPRGGGRPW